MAEPFTFAPDQQAKRHAPATERNRDVIADVLQHALPSSGIVLEIASGTGEHLVHFARCFPDLWWLPSDYDAVGLASIEAWSAEATLPNIKPPVQIDASAPDWPVASADAILCINMFHISPWTATVGLMSGSARLLPEGGLLYLYGPYREADVPTAASNEAFDESLKARNPEWGLRNKEDVLAVAAQHGLVLEHRIAMPANNLSLILRRK